MQKLLDSLRGAFGSYLMEASFKQVKFINSLVKKAPNALKILTKHNVDLSGDDLDTGLTHLSTKEASLLIGDLIQDTENSHGVVPVASAIPHGKVSGGGESGGWKTKKASNKQIGYVLSMMAQLGYANWRKSTELAKKYKKPPKTQELAKMTSGEISKLISVLKTAIDGAYA